MKEETFDGDFFAKNDEIIIRKPLAEDIPSLSEIDWIDAGLGEYNAEYAISLWKSIHNPQFGGVVLAAIDANDNEIVGELMLKHISDEPAEIGIVIREGFRNKGYGFRSISLLLSEINKRLGRTTFTVKVNSENTASLKLFRKLGAVPISEEDTTWNNYINIIKQELQDEGIKDIEEELRDRGLLDRVDDSVVRVFEIHSDNQCPQYID